jgi:FAD/FMN-containing dehydrogenase
VRIGRKRLKEEIILITGRSGVSDSAKVIKENSSDASGIGSRPLAVVFPRDKEQVAGIVRLANRTGTVIVPRGGGSGLCGGATADRALVLNMARMSKVVRVDAADGFVDVQPGIILDRLNAVLRRKGMFMPVQPASHALASVGGMVATDAGGEHVLRYGRMSANLVSLVVVRGDGEVSRLGKRAAAAFCGSEGILGIVVEARLRILPLIARKSMSVREPQGIAELMAEVKEFREAGAIACEFINPVLYSMIGGKRGYFLLAEFAGDAGEIRSRGSMRRYWRIREGCNPLLTRSGWGINGDPRIPEKGIPRFLRWCERHGIPSFGHIGHGVIHVHMREGSLMDSMYSLVRRLGGQVSGEHGIGMTKKRYLPAARKRRLMRMKSVYDPNGIMNRGKVI